MWFYLSRGFISEFDSFCLQVSNNSADYLGAQDCYSLIFGFKDLLENSVQINTNLDNEELRDALAAENGNLIQRILKERLKNRPKTLVRNDKFKELDDIGIYCISEDKNMPFNEGVISITQPERIDTITEIRLNCNVSQGNIPKSSDYDNLPCPPTNALVYHDNYFLKQKSPIYVNRFMNWVESMIPENLSKPFQVTVITSELNADDIETINKNWQILEKRVNSIHKLELQVLRYNPQHGEKTGKYYQIISRDRYYITNYTFGSFSHPFDKNQPSCIHNQTFLPLPPNPQNIENLNKDISNRISEIVSFTYYFRNPLVLREKGVKVFCNKDFKNRLITRYSESLNNF